MRQLLGSSVTYRIAVGPQAGRKKVVYPLKTPYRDGTTHVVFEPPDCMTHIPVRHPAGDLTLVANRLYCRSVIARLAALVPRPRVNLTRYHGVLAANHRWRAQVTSSGRGRGQGRASAQPERSAIERILAQVRGKAGSGTASRGPPSTGPPVSA